MHITVQSRKEETMKTVRRRMFIGLFFLCFIFSLGASCWTGASAADYPDRPITLVVPYPPGGSTDLAARVYADFLEKLVKQPVVVANKAGGASTVGGNFVAQAKPDGYTLGYFPFHTAVPEVFNYFMDAPYSSKDFRPICTITAAITVVAVKTGAPWNSLKEVIEYAKKNPGMKFGHNGKNTPPFRLAAMLDKQEKLGLVFVPFQGDSEVALALLGDHIGLSAPIYASIKSLADGKKVKLLAASSKKRLDFAPDIPTVNELGYNSPSPDPQSVYGPKGTPDAVVKLISDASRKVVENPEYRNKVFGLGVPILYQDTATIEKANPQVKEEVYTFFKGEGLIK